MLKKYKVLQSESIKKGMALTVTQHRTGIEQGKLQREALVQPKLHIKIITMDDGAVVNCKHKYCSKKHPLETYLHAQPKLKEQGNDQE